MKYTINHNVIKKWSMIIDSMINSRNKFLKDHICNFCEWISKNDTNENVLPKLLEDISKKIEKIDRVEIVAKVFNPITCIEEYKLNNGRYIPVTGNILYEFSTDELSYIFGIEYIKYLDIVIIN